ncbi:hypothetical protein KBC79_01620 [Candidatus Woesebacteria bacterium]|nr:hypothetical protein [Candidatus Woesebacteria bacterium]
MLSEWLYILKRPYHFLKTGILNGLVSEITNGFPARKLTVLAITGTDGKTTSSTLLYSVLKEAGFKVALLSTVAAYKGDEAIDTGFHVTSPQPADVQRFMRQLVEEGYTHLVLEVTSHGAFQYRTWGIRPTIAGITNIAHEHLDYHITYDNYVEAKSLLLKQAPTVVLNASDTAYYRLRKILTAEKHSVLTYAPNDSLPPIVRTAIKSRFSEQYNQMNARLVYLIAKQLGVTNKTFAQAITQFPGISGRMERINNKRGIDIVVDFAHTPQGLTAALTALRSQITEKGSKAKLIAVYGAAGLRDFRKRPQMGYIGAELADSVVLTAEDPRTENVWSIINQMKSNLGKFHNKVISIADRKAAIEFALKELAKRGDTVAILGKGHEQSMCFGTTEYPWSDQQAVRDILET